MITTTLYTLLDRYEMNGMTTAANVVCQIIEAHPEYANVGLGHLPLWVKLRLDALEAVVVDAPLVVDVS